MPRYTSQWTEVHGTGDNAVELTHSVAAIGSKDAAASIHRAAVLSTADLTSRHPAVARPVVGPPVVPAVEMVED